MIPYDYLDSASFYGSLWSPYNKPKWFWPQARSPCYHHCCRASSWPNSDPSIPCGKLPRTHLLNSIETQVTCETNLIHMGYETGVHPQAPWKKGKLMINHQDLGPCFVVATNPPAGQVSFIQNKPRTTPQKKTLKNIPELPTRYIIIIIMVYLCISHFWLHQDAIGREIHHQIHWQRKSQGSCGAQKICLAGLNSWSTETHSGILNNSWLVVEPPTPLKNDGVRQLGVRHSQLNGKSLKTSPWKSRENQFPENAVETCWECTIFNLS